MSYYVMFGSSLPLVVCRREHVLLRYLYLFAYSGVLHILCCVFVPRVYPMLPVSLDCPFLIAPPSFSNMYQVHTRSYTHLSLLLLLLLYHYFCDMIDLL